MMTCAQVQMAIREGRALDADVWAHAQTCDACAVLLDGEGALGLALVGLDDSHLPVPSAGAVLAVIEADTGLRATLRRMPTAVQAGFVGMVTVSVLGGVVAAGIRPDIASYPIGRMVGAFVALLAAGVAALAVQLRPLHRPALPGYALPLVLTTAVAVPLVLAGLPEAASGDASHGDQALLPTALGCFLYGSGAGLAVFLLLRAVDRRSRTPWPLVVLSATLLGLAGNLALQLHCPLTAPAHLVLGHATIGAAWAAVTGLGALARGR